MCDTIVALGDSTEDGSVIFAKNSDRDPGEVHAIVFIPRADHQEGEIVHCQYVDVPQVIGETNAVILAKPVWLKIGCEMGANEYGVVMGNEAVFTKEKYEREALLGMDLMTLSLQRSKTAYEALNLITNLIDEYGQGGVASKVIHDYIYHNSFIIADLNEAWVLETAGRFWVAKKVQNMASISNGLTIQDEWDIASPGLVENAVKNGWYESKSDFNFTKAYSDPDLRSVLGCVARQTTTLNELQNKKGEITVSTMMNILRTHDKAPFRPDKGTMSSVCEHYNSGTFSQTTGSYVASLTKEFQIHWLTGTSAPCLSVFKPFFFESPESLRSMKTPLLTNDNESLWWKHEKLHRLVLMDYITRAPIIIEKNIELEKQFIHDINIIKQKVNTIKKDKLIDELNAISSSALSKNFPLIENLIQTIKSMEISKSPRKAYLKFWNEQNEKDGLILI